MRADLRDFQNLGGLFIGAVKYTYHYQRSENDLTSLYGKTSVR